MCTSIEKPKDRHPPSPAAPSTFYEDIKHHRPQAQHREVWAKVSADNSASRLGLWVECNRAIVYIFKRSTPPWAEENIPEPSPSTKSVPLTTQTSGAGWTSVSVVWFSPKGSGFKPVCRHSVTCSRPPRARCSLTHIHSSGTCVPRCYVMLSLIHTRISLFEEQKESGAEKVVKLWRQKEFCLNCAFGMGAGPGLTVIGRGHGFTLQTSFIEETTRGKEEGIHWLHSFEKSSFKKLNPSNTALIYFLMLYRGDGWFQPAVETQSSTPLCSSLNEMD